MTIIGRGWRPVVWIERCDRSPTAISGSDTLQRQLRRRAIVDGVGARTLVMTTPVSTMLIHRGDIFWIAAEEPLGLAHPHVVVQDDVFNHSRITTVVVCALTSNLHRASEPGNVLLAPGEADLPRQSVVVVSQISSVAKTCLGARIGTLSAERVDQIIAGLRFQQVSFFAR